MTTLKLIIYSDIFGVVSHTLFIKCMQLAARGHVKRAGRGVHAHTATTFNKGSILAVISVTVCTK